MAEINKQEISQLKGLKASSRAILALANGKVFYGISIGAEGLATGELVFNTAMTGYQEILTDPSYCKQIVTLTNPHIGNTGVNDLDAESSKVFAAGLVIRDLPLIYSNFRAQMSLSDYLKQNNCVAIADVDTRAITRILREQGAQNACIMAGDNLDAELAIEQAQQFVGLSDLDLAKEVTCDKSYLWQQGEYELATNSYIKMDDKQHNYHVVAYDFGVKHNILRMLVQRGCKVTVVPAQTSAQEVLALNPDGVFLSNGPGDPAPCTYAIEAIQQFLSVNMPLFGICLGHQLLALAVGGKTQKMKHGHHGANHPVQDLASKKVVITSQNHGFAVDELSLPREVMVTHKSLFDHTVQGIKHLSKPAFSMQGHPEASPGPTDCAYLFDDFVTLMRQKCH